MKQIHRWACEKCGVEYDIEEVAKACEAVPVSPCPVRVGDEIKLRNRRHETYTVATVAGLRVCSSFEALGMRLTSWPKHDGTYGWLADYFKDSHQWIASLKESVYLDHNWEDRTNEIALFVYWVNDEEAATMHRCDDCANGDSWPCHHVRAGRTA